MTGIRLALAGLAVLLLAGCGSTPGGTQATPSAPRNGGVASTSTTGADMRFDLATVRGQLDDIQIKRVDPYNAYDRVGDFGDAWTDVDRNGCDTRSDVLRRDLDEVRMSGGCKVETGTLHDPYSGSTVRYVRGAQSSQAVQIDHVVPLYEAWRTGAQDWSHRTRVRFANDPLNLLAVDGDRNQDKGDDDPSRWLPPLASYRCEYVERYVTVVAKYGLFVTDREKPAMERALDGCPA